MRLTRNKLRRMILQEIRRLNEGVLTDEAQAQIEKRGSVHYRDIPKRYKLEDGDLDGFYKMNLGGVEYTVVAAGSSPPGVKLKAIIMGIPRKLQDKPNSAWSQGSSA